MGKLVRDKIPEIIRESGGDPHVRYLNENEYREELYNKLREEVEELIMNRNAEEMADVIEVIKCIYANDTDIYSGVFYRIHLKAKEKGSFYNRVYLED